MKKTLAFFLAILITFMGVHVWAAEEVVAAEEKLSKEILLLTNLDILQGYPDGTFRPDAQITRSEFAAILARTMRMGNYPMQSSFEDVPSDHFAAGAIAYVNAAGYMRGVSATEFDPDANITYEEILTSLVRMTGYEIVAEQKGGFPEGYVIAASDIGIVDGLAVSDFGDDATRGNSAFLLYHALFDVDVMEPVYGTNEYNVTSKNLYDMLFSGSDIVKIHGVVDATEKTSLHDTDGTRPGKLSIDGELYDVAGVNYSDYLGYGVEAHYKQESVDDYTLVSVVPYHTEVVSISAEDVAAASNTEITYYDPERDGKKEVLKLDAAISVIYNGIYKKTPYQIERMISDYGTLRLIDNDDDGWYEVLFIDSYESFIIDKVNVNTSTIFIKDALFMGRNSIHLDPSFKELRYILTDAEGTPVGLEDMKEWDVITVMSDYEQTYMTLLLSDKTVTGEMVEFNTDEKTIILDDTLYQTTMDLTTITPEAKEHYLVDAMGRIVGINEDATSIEQYAICTAKEIRGSMNAMVQLKLVFGGNVVDTTEDKRGSAITYEVSNTEVGVYTLAEQVQYNGQRKKAEEIYDLLEIGVPFMFRTNSEGEIGRIEVFSSDGLHEKKNFNPEVLAFGGEFCIDEHTIVLIHPSNPVSDDDDYLLPLEFNSGTKYEILGYEIDDETDVAKIAVITEQLNVVGGTLKRNAPLAVVTEVKRILADNGEGVMTITGYRDGEPFKYQAEENLDGVQPSQITKGSLIYFSLNSKNLIDKITYVGNVKTMDVPFHTGTQQAADETAFGKLYTLEKEQLHPILNNRVNGLGISLNNHGTDLIYNIPINSMPAIYRYDTRRDEVKVLTVYDLMPYTEYNVDASNVFLTKRNFAYTGIVVVE